MKPTVAPAAVHIIAPPKGFLSKSDFSELWRFRELLLVFTWRDIKVRYKQTVFGVLWAIFQPVFTMVVFSIFFGGLAKVPSDGRPYPVFAYAGLLYWTYFSTAVSATAGSLITQEGIIRKVYFPRLILPLYNAITPAVDFLFALAVFFVIMGYYHVVPTLLGIVLVPLLLVLSIIAASGVGIFLSAINVKYRDVRYILPFFIQMLLFVTPVIYPTSSVPARLQWLIKINPMTGIISTARASMLGTGHVDWAGLGISVVSSLALLLIGLTYFRRTERFFADII